jgi:hypothetical protein
MNLHQIFLPVHLAILAFVAWTVIHADHMAFSWIRGRVTHLDEAKVRRLHRHTWYGLIGMIITGILMFIPLREFLLTRPQFYAKMAFVAGLVVNGFVIGHLQKVAFNKTFKELTVREKIPLFISGAVSTLCWIFAAIGGLYLIPD